MALLLGAVFSKLASHVPVWWKVSLICFFFFFFYIIRPPLPGSFCGFPLPAFLSGCYS
jgi:hypothetical protein